MIQIPNKKKFFNVLVPAYEFKDGIQRIIKHYKISNDNLCNLIISDDSHTDDIEDLIKSYYENTEIFYERNTPSLGAVNNWNKLLENNDSEYLILLHQDECPESETFYEELKNLIIQEGNPDLIFLRCCHQSKSERYYYPIFDSLYLRFILKFFPSYIFRRNIIGSPSNVVVSNKALKKFDSNLKWLVDVDWFYSMISKDNWIIAKDINIISIFDENTSITNSISKNLDSILLKETDYLHNKFNNFFVSKLLKPKNLFDYFLVYFERLAWMLTKVYQICYSILSRKSMPNWW